MLAVSRGLATTSSAHTLQLQSPTLGSRHSAGGRGKIFVAPQKIFAEGGVALQTAHRPVVAAEARRDGVARHTRLAGAAEDAAARGAEHEARGDRGVVLEAADGLRGGEAAGGGWVLVVQVNDETVLASGEHSVT